MSLRTAVLIPDSATALARLIQVQSSTATRWYRGTTKPSQLAIARLSALGLVLKLPPKRKPARTQPVVVDREGCEIAGS
jgi:hypothetical protein